MARPQRPQSLVRFEDLELDLRAGELRQTGGKTVRLPEQPMQILILLLKSPGEVVLREEIRNQLWPNDTIVEFEHSINAAMKRLRQALGESAENPRYIETLARRGYRWKVPVQWVEVQRDSPRPAEPEIEVHSPNAGNGSLIGKRVSHYRVLGVLGGGGMGVVYKAEDLKLGRRVALKFLPEELAGDSGALQRFESEARSASALNHPNICTIYGVEEYEGHPFLVMEFLEGQTLRDLIVTMAPAKPAFELPRLLDFAVQITAGLEAAHRQGIIHRDIKPANIFVTGQGYAKILDFGLAKLFLTETAPTDSPATDHRESGGSHEPKLEAGSLTASSPFLSRTGVAMGTAGYMSPEQVRGEKLDARTDLFSFGLVLYEMATGKRAFSGDEAPVLRDAILNRAQSPARDLNPALPPKLEKIIGRALEKNREARYQSAAELRMDLESVKRELLPKSHTLRWLGTAAIILALLLVSTVVWIKKRPPSPVPDLKLRQLTFNPPENPVTSGAISPDGKYLAFSDTKGMHVQTIDTGEVHSVPPPDLPKGTEVNWEILHSSWFPDSSRFIANAHPAGEDENASSSETSSIWMFTANGGAPRKLRDHAMAWSVSPDGSLISFGTNKGKWGEREIWLMGPDGQQARKLFDGGEGNCLAALVWRSDGQRVIYIRSEAPDGSHDTLVSTDLKGGPTVTVLPPSETINLNDYSWLPDGRLIYAVMEHQGLGVTSNYWVLQLDARTSQPIEKPTRLTNWAGFYLNNTGATANSKRLAFLEYRGLGTVYMAELAAGGTRIINSRQFTLGGNTYLQAWTPDSKTILFGSNRAGTFELYKQSLNSDEVEVLAGTEIGFRQARVSPDGKWVMAYRYPIPGGPSSPEQLMRIPFTGGSPEPIFTGNPRGAISCTNHATNFCVVVGKTEDHKQLIVTAFDPVKGWGRELARFASDPNAQEQWCDWQISPDGTRLAANEDGHIHILSLRGYPEQVLQQPKGLKILDYYWAADSRGLYAGGPGMGKRALLLLDLQGNIHVVWDDKGAGNTWGAPSPDGRHLAFMGWTDNRNMWIMENF